MLTCPSCETITGLEICPNCDLILVGDNKGEERFDVNAKPEDKKPKEAEK